LKSHPLSVPDELHGLSIPDQEKQEGSEDASKELEQVYETLTNGNKLIYSKGPGACIIRLIMAIICWFRNKLECLSLNTRLSWKGLPGTYTLAYYANRKLLP